MVLQRRFFMVFLVFALLLRSAAGLTMQIEMVYGIAQARATQQAVPPCHLAMQNMDAPLTDGVSPTPSNNAATNTTESSGCSLCCVLAVMPSAPLFVLNPVQYPAPTAALFNSLPAAAQRPTKPPLV